jgi:hypothetical protein
VSVSSDLAAVFSIPELTVPVQLGAAGTRGFLDSAGATVPLAATEIQRIGTVLYLQKDSLAGLTEQASVIVGALGAATVAGGTSYRIASIDPVDDGLILACVLGGGR